MPHLDALNGDAFSMASLTARLLDSPHIPRQAGDLGLFEESGVATTSISVERQNNTLVLVETTERGAPAIQNVKDPRNLTQIPTVRVAMEDTVIADEVQNLRAFGSEDSLEPLEAEVGRRMLRESNSIEATMEFHRIGALRGLVLDADGSTLYDLFTIFGVVAQTPVDFVFSASPGTGALRTVAGGIIRTIEDEIGGLPYRAIHAYCGTGFFDALIASDEYRAWQVGWGQAAALADRTARMTGDQFPRRVTNFAGIDFEEYRGNVGPAGKFIADDAAIAFPVGVPECFITKYGPAEYWDTVNTIGLPRYVRQVRGTVDPDIGRTFRVQTHPVTICTRPRVLIGLTHS